MRIDLRSKMGGEQEQFQVVCVIEQKREPILKLTLVKKGQNKGWRLRRRIVRIEGNDIVFTGQWKLVRRNIKEKAFLRRELEIRYMLQDVWDYLKFPSSISDALRDWVWS
ncbi:hypothetical protein FJY90_06160 [Candidatus Gottesmanbacteria bacterium]|nr:hypothetical protein [Candidatus Gottesmanbacteria bacterium]